MNNILYYPYINLPRTDWTLRTLLYYDNIGSIVPQEYFYEPEANYDEFMLELVRDGLVSPINPMDVINNPWEVTKPFLELIDKNKKKLKRARSRFSQGNAGLIHQDKFLKSRIHADKFDENIFYSLEQMGLAESQKGRWYAVENKTADQLMRFLATIVSAKTNRLPTTDYIKPRFFKNTFASHQRKRETILSNLIPFPEKIDLKKLTKFKEKHSDLLKAFKNRVEILTLDENIKEGSEQFDENLMELLLRKKELNAKMNESQFGNILFGTVCGIIGAVQGLSTAETTGAIIGGLPGFVSAVHSAIKIEKAEDVFDQSGLKYLALADKRITR